MTTRIELHHVTKIESETGILKKAKITMRYLYITNAQGEKLEVVLFADEGIADLIIEPRE